MPSINDLTAYEQRQVEHQFAAVAYQFPLYSIQQCGWLRPDTLRDGGVRQFWTKIIELVQPSMNDDQAEIAAAEASVMAGIDRDLSGWIVDMVFGATPQSYAREIARRAYLAGIAPLVGQLARAVGSADDQQVRTIISQMAETNIESGVTMRTAADADELFRRVVESGNRTIPTGLPGLDQATGGLERQTEIIIAARPSMGKSALVWQIARTAAANHKRVAFFSLEMSIASLWARAACPAAEVIWRDVLAGKITPKQKERLLEESREQRKLHEDYLYIEDTPQTTETIWQAVSTLQPDLVVVDHLRLLKDRPNDRSEVKRIGWCSQQLREIGKAFNLPMLVVAQLNRGVENNNDKRPSLADLRDSGEIEENADVVMMLYSDSYYNPPAKPTDIFPTEVWIRKFRDGARNILVKLNFDARQEWFNPLNA